MGLLTPPACRCVEGATAVGLGHTHFGPPASLCPPAQGPWCTRYGRGLGADGPAVRPSPAWKSCVLGSLWAAITGPERVHAAHSGLGPQPHGPVRWE